MKTFSIEKQNELGKEIALILCLKKNKNEKYVTMWGEKTAIGLLNLVCRIVKSIEIMGGEL